MGTMNSLPRCLVGALIFLAGACTDPPGDPVLIIDLVGDNSRAVDITGLDFSPQRVELLISESLTSPPVLIVVPDSGGKTLSLGFSQSHIARESLSLFAPKAGFLHQIRFIEDGVDVIGPAAAGGAIAKVPSGLQTGIKISPADGVPFELQRHRATRIEAKFDVRHQVNRPKTSEFHFKPSLRAALVTPATDLPIPLDEVVVGFRNGISDAARSAAILGFDSRSTILFSIQPALDLQVVSVPFDRTLLEAIEYFQAHRDVEYSMPRIVVTASADNPRAMGTPDESSFTTGAQSYLTQIFAPAAWDRQIGSMGTIVAVIDTGIDIKHPDIVPNLFLNSGEIPPDLLALLKDVEPDGLITFRDLNDPANAGIVQDSNGNNFIDGEDVLKDRAAGGLADGLDNDVIVGETTNVVDDLIGARMGMFPPAKVCQPEVCTPVACQCFDAIGQPNNGTCGANGTCPTPCTCTGGCVPGPCVMPVRIADKDVNDDGVNPIVNGHGTAVAGLIGAQGGNGQSIAGVNWNVRILPIKACGGVDLGCEFSSIGVDAMRYARRMGATIVNMSLSSTSGAPPTAKNQADVDRLVTNGYQANYSKGLNGAPESVLITVAAGNGVPDTQKNFIGQNCDAFQVVCVPAELKMTNMIVVGAVDSDQMKTGFSDFGPETVDFVAPGQAILTLSQSQGTQILNGTSFATPLVTGTAALMIAQKPSLASDIPTLRATLLNSGTSVPTLPSPAVVPFLNAGSSVTGLVGP